MGSRSIKFKLLLFLLGMPLSAATQVDTTLQAPTVTVTAGRLYAWQPGQEAEILDSSQQTQAAWGTVADVLTTTADIFVKQYGPANIATGGASGLGAAYTNVFWHGLPLQHPMLGVVDLSVLPALLFDQVVVVSGNNSPLWGNGAIGSAIHLQQQMPKQPGLGTTYRMALGSYGQQQYAWTASLRRAKWMVDSRLFHQQADNDYPYRDISGEQRPLPHAQTRMRGVLQECRWQPNPQHEIGLHAWWQHSRRAFPPTRVQATSLAGQQDNDLRLAADWKWRRQHSHWLLRTGLLRSRLTYTDTLSGIGSDSYSHIWLAEVDGNIQLNDRWQLNTGLGTQWLGIESTAYAQSPQQHRLAGWSALRYHSPSKRWESVLMARQEIVDGRLIPLTPTLHTAYYPYNRLTFGASFGRSYRLPTFNDLYWPQSGNPELRPEQGWQATGRIQWQPEQQGWTSSWQLNLFVNKLEQQIIWLPRQGIWIPQNINRSRSHGAGLRWKASWEVAQGQLAVRAQYRYTRAVQQGSTTAAGTERLQVAYVPRHRANLSWQWQYRRSRLAYDHRWTGQVFTLADRQSTLPAYHLGSLIVAQRLGDARHGLLLEINIENIWNKDYEVVRHYPMPGRRWQIGIRYRFHNKSARKP